MQDFQFHRPGSIQQALSTLRERGEAKVLGGGQSLIPVMKLGLAAPSDLVSIANLGELRGIRIEGKELVVGAATVHADVADSPEVKRALPGLAALAAEIGDPQVRNRGTLGGSLAHDDPAADYPAAVLALGATIVTDRRRIPADDFFEGMYQTALHADELIVSVRFPLAEKAAYAKLRHPASRFALVGVMVAKGPAGVRVAVTGAGPSVFRVPAWEQALAARFAPEAIAEDGVKADGLQGDAYGSAEFRAHLAAVLARRAVAACG